MHIQPRYIRHKDAPAYLGMCREVFDRDVRPYITEIPIGGRGVGFDRLDLDRWADEHKAAKGTPPRIASGSRAVATAPHNERQEGTARAANALAPGNAKGRLGDAIALCLQVAERGRRER